MTALPPPPTFAPVYQAPPLGPGPSKKGYVVGWCLLGGGVLLAVILIILGTAGVVHGANTFTDTHSVGSVRANHKTHVKLKSGDYVLYYEGDAVGQNEADSDETAPSFKAKVFDPSGAAVDVYGYDGMATYTDGSRHGIAAKSFTADEAGTYEVEVGSLPGGSDARVTVGKDLSLAGFASFAGGVVAIIAGIWLGALFAFVGLVVVIITAVRRYSYRQKLVQPAAVYRPPPSPPGGFGSAPPPPSAPPPAPSAPPPPPPGAGGPPPPPAPGSMAP